MSNAAVELPPRSQPATSARPAQPGPDTISWRINREIVMLAGWSTAVLLQLAHPLVLQGVLDHSIFVADPARRLERANATVQSFLLLAFGDERQMLQAAGRINAIHDYVHGCLPRAAGRFGRGTPYSAHDPELLRWVHATLVEVLPRTYERFVGPLTAPEKESFLWETAEIEPLLGIPAGFLPRSTGALRRYMDCMYASGAIVVTDEARQLAKDILRPPLPLPGWLLRLLTPVLPLLYWLNALPTIGLLPPHIRRAYGFGWSPFQAATLRVTSTLLRELLPLTPPLLRHWRMARLA